MISQRRARSFLLVVFFFPTFSKRRGDGSDECSVGYRCWPRARSARAKPCFSAQQLTHTRTVISLWKFEPTLPAAGARRRAGKIYFPGKRNGGGLEKERRRSRYETRRTFGGRRGEERFREPRVARNFITLALGPENSPRSPFSTGTNVAVIRIYGRLTSLNVPRPGETSSSLVRHYATRSIVHGDAFLENSSGKIDCQNRFASCVRYNA